MHNKRILFVGLILAAAALACSVGGATSGDEPGGETAVLLQDDFSNPSTGWEIGDYQGGSVGYSDGIYFVTSTESGGIMWGLSGHNFGDVDVTVEATQISGPDNDNNGYGIGCRIQANDDGYFLRISGDGYYSIARTDDGEFTYLVDWDTSNRINTGNATNTIRVVCSGDTLELYVNDRRVADATDSTYTTGDITLTATTFETTPTTVHFDDIVVREP
jgi:hypothetical protein